LQPHDYLSANYTRTNDPLINFTVLYFRNQAEGRTPHSPAVCLPSGGWEITEFSEVALHVSKEISVPINRAVIASGPTRHLVYYWFQGRGQVDASEFLVKWHIFLDMVTEGRSDGALVRLITPIGENEGDESAEQRLSEFARQIYEPLWTFVP
jgi:EpsI family protein